MKGYEHREAIRKFTPAKVKPAQTKLKPLLHLLVLVLVLLLLHNLLGGADPAQLEVNSPWFRIAFSHPRTPDHS